MTYKRKTQQDALDTKQESYDYEQGVTAETPEEIRERWIKEYKRNQQEVLPKPGKPQPLF